MSVLEEKWELIYPRYKRLVRAYCSEFTTVKEDLDDLVQEVWLRVWQYRPQCPITDAQNDWAPWLTAVTRNVCRTYLERTIGRTPELVSENQLIGSDEEDDGSWIDLQSNYPDDNPENEVIRDEEWVIRYATVSEKEIAAVNLVYWHGYSYTAAAKIMKLAVGTVGALVARAKVKFEPSRLFYGDKVYLYRPGGNPWGDWSWQPDGPANKKMEEIAIG